MFRELTCVSLISSLGADPQAVAARWESTQYSPSLTCPGAPPPFVRFGEDDGYLDDVLPGGVTARKRCAYQNDAYRRSARPPGEVDINAIGVGSTNQTIDLTSKEAVKVSIETAVLSPDEVELPVVGLNDLVQQHSFHSITITSPPEPAGQ